MVTAKRSTNRDFKLTLSGGGGAEGGGAGAGAAAGGNGGGGGRAKRARPAAVSGRRGRVLVGGRALLALRGRDTCTPPHAPRQSS